MRTAWGRPRWPQAVQSAAAVAFGLLGQWAFHSLVPEVPFAPYSIAAWLVRAAPGGLATQAIEIAGPHAKPALAWAVIAAVVALGAFSRSAISVLVAALVVGAVSVVAEPLPVAAANAALSIITLVAVTGIAWWAWDALRGGLKGERPERRRFLELTAATAIGAVCLAAGLRRNNSPEVLVLPALKQPYTPASNPEFDAVLGLSPGITAPADHYVVDINFEPPIVDWQAWRLRIEGLVANPQSKSFDEVATAEASEIPVLLHCISNPVGGKLVGNALWTSISLTSVLAAAGLSPEVRTVVAHGADGYSVAIPVDSVEEVFVAWAMGGEAIPRRHGFPVRMLWPGHHGMLSVKWLTRLEATSEAAEGYWAERGWDREGLLETGSRIDTPERDAAVESSATVAGVAWARDGISRVEVSFDDEATWLSADLESSAGALAWRRWKTAGEFDPGRTTVSVRAMNAAGEPQTPESRSAHPGGATGIHRVIVERGETGR